MKDPKILIIQAATRLTRIRSIIRTKRFIELWESKTEQSITEENKQKIIEYIEKNDADGFCRLYYKLCNNELELMSRKELRLCAAQHNIPYYGKYNNTELRRLISHAILQGRACGSDSREGESTSETNSSDQSNEIGIQE